eukprot:4795394-Pyramimonas_sp.AAC.1
MGCAGRCKLHASTAEARPRPGQVACPYWNKSFPGRPGMLERRQCNSENPIGLPCVHDVERLKQGKPLTLTLTRARHLGKLQWQED